MKTRKLGEKLIKISGAGFTGETLRVQIPDETTYKEHFGQDSDIEDNISCCLVCDDPNCREFANLMVLDENWNPLPDDWVYHVSECQLKDKN